MGLSHKGLKINKFAIDFQEKANFFNSLFSKQCSPIPSCSVLPPKISCNTKDSTQTVCFGESDVIKLIKAFDVIKTRGHDEISVL